MITINTLDQGLFFFFLFGTNSTALHVNICLIAFAIKGLQVSISQTANKLYLHYLRNCTNQCS